MDTPTPNKTSYSNKNELSEKEIIKLDITEKFKELLKIHLEGRTFKEEKIKSWLNNILEDAKDYFVKKYTNYDIFLFVHISSKDLYYRSNADAILVNNSDAHDFVDYYNDYFYCILRFIFYKHYDLDYSIENYEDEIIQKTNEILKKYLEDRKFIKENAEKNNLNINSEIANFILDKEKYLRIFTINKIYKKPLSGKKYFFKYYSYGKNIYSKIIKNMKMKIWNAFISFFSLNKYKQKIII